MKSNQTYNFQKNVLIVIGVALSFTLGIACKPNYDSCNNCLKFSGNNKSELKKVIKLYRKNDKDSLKLKACRFLITNMLEHYTLSSDQLNKYDCFFDLVEAKSRDGYDPEPIKNIWDSLQAINGTIRYSFLDTVHDLNTISANYIIENIDYAFKAWEKPWAQHLSFDDFCNYILPYRIKDERLENYRPTLYKRYQWLETTTPLTDPIQACKLLNQEIGKWFFENWLTAPQYPITMRASDIIKLKSGSCLNQAAITTYIMRSNGIPVVLEYIPQWGNRSNSHYFNAVQAKQGQFISFLGGDHDPGEYVFLEKPPKVFRRTYAKIENELLKNITNINNIPPLLRDPFYIDVSSERIDVKDIKIDLDIEPIENTAYAYLCVFNNRNWIPVYFGRIEKGKAYFKNMGKDIVYLPVYYFDNKILPASHPFILSKSGKVSPLKPDKSNVETVRINRKYPLSDKKIIWMASQIGGIFEGANNSNFSDAVELYTNKDTIDLVTNKIMIESKQKFQFIRYLFAPGASGTISELGFHTLENGELKLLKGDKIKSDKVAMRHLNIAFDRDIRSYIGVQKDCYNGEWIGLNLGKPQTINQISFCPRTDTNNIFEGMQYELYYWNNRWVSLGVKTADKNELVFDSVPSKALLWLRNLTEGKEERIFTYENGSQVWW